MSGYNKLLLYRICPLLDFLVALVFICFSGKVTELVAPYLGWSYTSGVNLLTAIPLVASVALIGVPVILRSVGFYHRRNMQRPSTALRQLCTAVLYYLCGLGLYLSLRDHSLAFDHILLVNIICIPVFIFLRFLAVRVCLQVLGKGQRCVVLAGSREDVASGWEKLPASWKDNFSVVGYAYAGECTEKSLQEMIEKYSPNHLFVFGGLTAYHANEAAIMQCEVQGIDIYLMLKGNAPVNLRASLNVVEHQRVLMLSSTPAYSWGRLVKDVMDRVVAVLILLCSLPLWIVAAIGIKLSDPDGPIFYRQQRSGRFGKPFGMWKFRSMYKDADARLEEVKKEFGNEMNGPIFKLTNDPRIFRFGHFIRKTSIDELPQLLNIISGDMSIVGPRPLPVYETAEFPDIAHRRRLSVKPGLTCYWQIEDRSDNGDFDNMINKDLRYIDNWSLWLDVCLFFRTIPAVLFGKGAK